MGDKPTLKKGVYQNPNSERSKESIDRYVRGMRDKKYGGKRINTDRIRKFKKGMTPGQAKLAAKAPPPNKIDAKDFAVLRDEKAKGRGMGLQDEKVQPGKVMKARMGKDVSYKNYLKGLKKATSEVKGSRGSSKINPTTLKAALMKSKNAYSDLVKTTAKGPKRYSSMAEMRKAKGFKPGESASDFNKRRMKLEGAKVLKSAGTRGKIALGIGAAGVGALQYLKSKMKKKDEPKKKMGGGMMKRPMGYNAGGSPKKESPTIKYLEKDRDSRKKDIENLKRNKPTIKKQGVVGGYSKGTMVKARGCKLGRSKATKIT